MDFASDFGVGDIKSWEFLDFWVELEYANFAKAS
jgi:hypothetical protein